MFRMGIGTRTRRRPRTRWLDDMNTSQLYWRRLVSSLDEFVTSLPLGGVLMCFTIHGAKVNKSKRDDCRWPACYASG